MSPIAMSPAPMSVTLEPAAVTVMSEVPVLVSQVAVMVTGPPAATPVTSPLAFTVATAVLALDQVTTRPVSGVPPPSLGVAVSCVVLPASTAAEAGLTVTEATGTLETVIAAVPVTPSQVAVMVAEPAATPVTNPLASTVATPVWSLDQVTTRPESGSPWASFSVAVRLVVPAVEMVAEVGLTTTEATGVGPTGVPWPEDFAQEPSAMRARPIARIPAYCSQPRRGGQREPWSQTRHGSSPSIPV